MEAIEAKLRLDAIQKELLGLNLVLDDGRDSYNPSQNRRFNHSSRMLDSIVNRLLQVRVEGKEQELMDAWHSAASSHMNLPEEKYNSAIRYIVAVKELLNSN